MSKKIDYTMAELEALRPTELLKVAYTIYGVSVSGWESATGNPSPRQYVLAKLRALLS